MTEQQLRYRAKKLDAVLTKSRVHNIHLDNFGGYMLYDVYTGGVIAGSRWELSLADVEWLLSEPELIKQEQRRYRGER